MQRTVIHVALAFASSLASLEAQAPRVTAPAPASPLQQLHQERLKALAEVVASCRTRHAHGTLGKDAVDAAQEAWTEAALEAAPSHRERLVLLKELVTLEAGRCEEARQRVDLGTASREDLLRARAKRLSREIALLRAQSAGPRR